MAAPMLADLLATPVGDPEDADRLRRLLSASAGYCLEQHLPRNVLPDGTLRLQDEALARPVSAAALGLAVGVRCDVLDDVTAGPAAAAAVSAVRACVVGHISAGGWWGRSWQSPLVSSQAGLAGWLLFDQLPTATQGAVEAMVRDEADHLSGVDVHYLRDVDGGYLTQGDTGAEEESWRARGVSLALAMLPDDPSAQRWYRWLVLRQLAAYARPSEVAGTDRLHGAPICSWLAGSNMEENGDLQNHNLLPNPNYMRPVHHVGALVQQRLAGQPSSPAGTWNLELLYTAHSRYFREDGGLRYPDGTDVPARDSILYANDVEHRALGLGGREALRWERVHGTLTEQRLRPDGTLDEPEGPNAFDAPTEVAAKLGEAWMTLVLGPLSAYAFDGERLAGAPPQGHTPQCPGWGPTFPDVTGPTAAAASWAAGHGLLRGYPDGSFRPGSPLSRLAAVTTMFRAAGSPGDLPAHPFTDVPTDGGEADRAVRWGTATGLSRGTTASTFDPGAALTRGQAVVLLWRDRGATPAPPCGFTDVSGEVARAADWARAAGVTRGRTATTFDPTSVVDRGSWALMLHREHAVG